MKDYVSNDIDFIYIYVDKKFEYLEALIKEYHSQLMKSKNSEDNQPPKIDVSDKSMSCIVEVSNKKCNDEHQITAIVEKEDLEDDIHPYCPFEGCGITYQDQSNLIDKCIQWVTWGLLKSQANKKPTEDKYRAKASSFGFEMMNFFVAFLIDKKWFYVMLQPQKCWTTKHINVAFYYFRKKSKLCSMNQYRYTIVNFLFNTHIHNTYERYCNNQADDNISTQEHINCVSVVSVHGRSITNIMKGFSIPAELPWHLVDDVYISVNSDGRSLGAQGKNTFWRDKKLSRMLSSYLIDNGFFEQIGQNLMHIRTKNLFFYKSNSTFCCGDYGLYVAIFVEFLGDELVIPPDDFLSSYLRNRYAALLWKYDNDKAKD
ncbi:hypothetical protein H5410_031328 [Solanum commersonii]|uniref:Uncharacterized protein n=1 Tax=Solanum commersonii TaxID=4109 RepID=A0A9J5YLZ5_SOLCO|nr:hypothetical protein H5410_031328 [Solanum commersonii]